MFISLAIVVVATYYFGSWVYGAAVAVVLLIWRAIPRSEGPPVLRLAMTAQWGYATVGLWYFVVTGHRIEAMDTPAFEETMGIALATVAVLTLGIAGGVRYIQNRKPYPEVAPQYLVSFKTLVVIYFIAIAASGALQQVSFSYPALQQGMVAISVGRLAVVSLVLRRILRPVFRWDLMLLLLAFEIVIGFTGYFSGFKEPMLLAALALLEVFELKRVDHWMLGGGLAVGLGAALVMWVGVRDEVRKDFEDEAFATSRSARLDRIQSLLTDWYSRRNEVMSDNTDTLIDRAWVVYYPSLAIARVPSVLPHTQGEIFSKALVHLVTPRILFPNKPNLTSDSEMVRKYSGVYVAGEEQNTSIAFGYWAESYVDFGVPLMFAPMLVWGLLMGVAYEWFLRTIAYRELAVSLVMCLFWSNLYLFERSWPVMLGTTVTMFAYLGGPVYLLDRWLLTGEIARREGGVAADPMYGS